ncbi:chaperone protein dnaK [Aaosphaeria arxii CBS 175.79]|uniref:Chaperone protein dnaK n=1 Tax=Aaosphaeria arxii CBS 175.79 TaxID=1450172 RepID=A0A6A5XE18_9PLEO|nr:chaperone protein dnaK [Aaosphaeria arxii CBS 175.79]KAF2011111.1 chaperone protein dnaK [Aaosphaeria arxii CBS 175.79]
MAPPGRRRGAMSPLTILLGLIFLFSSTASAASAVLGVDLGTEYIKAVLVKPGIPLEIVLTKDSKRKETSAVAFKPSKSGALASGSFPERFYGSDAVALAARFPSNVYPNLKQLLGVKADDTAVGLFSERYPALQVTGTEGRTTVSLNSGIFAEGEGSFSVEELLAMELQNLKENALALAGKDSTVRDVVFTVPPFFTVEERRALEVSAKLAGLNVLNVVTDGLAVGINYATSRTFPVVTDGGKPEIHLVFDMGAGSASATVLKFQGKQVKDVGRFNKTIQEIQVLGTGWDRTLGGDALNQLIVNDMVESFVASPAAKSASVTTEQVKAHGRAASKLWKDAEKLRQVLSANTETHAFFEGLYDDVDFRYKATRARFEELAAEHAARVDGPINRALEAAGLTVADIDSFIVHGGATRTPFVQSRLEAIAGKSKIRANVNSDEAAVFGAAFKAAGLSPSFRVKEIRDQDTQGYTHGIQYQFNLKDRDQKIFTPLTKIGATKDIPFQMMGEFEFTMYQAVPGAGDSVTKEPVLHFKSGNLTRAVTKMIDTDGCDRDSFNNYVQVRLSPITGTPEVTSAWVTCVAEVEESKGGIVDGIKGFFGGGKKEQEPIKEGESASESSSSSTASGSSSAADAEPSEAAKGGKKKTEIKSAITYQVTQQGYEKHPRKEMKRMQDRLEAFDKSDRSRRTREEVLNSLEAFTYRARDYLEDESFIAASTASIRSQLEEKLSAASDWIYSEGADAAEDVLSARLKELKDLVDPVLARQNEAESRPGAIKELKEGLAGLESVIPMVKESIESASKAAEEASKSAAEASASAAAASAAASETPSPDPLAELEDDDLLKSSSASSTTEEPVFPTAINIYTEQDVTILEETVSKAKAWILEKETAQSKLGASDDAAVSIQELKEQTKKLNDVVMQMMTKKFNAMNQQQKPKKPKASKPKKSKKSKKAAKDEKKKKAAEAEKPAKEPTEEELQEALEKAGIKGEGVKFKNLGDKFKKNIESEDGRILTRLDLGEDATEEEILAALNAATQEKDKDAEAKHDEL